MTILIRPSSLPSWPDCSRRTVARLTPHLVAEAGYKLRTTINTVGSSVGTATHAAVGHTLTTKMNTGELANQTEAEDIAMDSLQESMRHGVSFDATSPNLNVAEKQVLRQYRTYRINVAPKITPVTVEHRITLETKRGNKLSGQPDQTTDGIRDLKTGVLKRGNIAQYGGYALLLEGAGSTVDHLIEDFVQRVKLDKEQPDPVEVRYDVKLAKRVAATIIYDIETKYERFMESGDNMTFMANPATVLCSEKFCPAHGTGWCMEGKR